MRQLLVLCDGTNNNLTGGKEDTHVVRVATLLRLTRCPVGVERLLYYDPGVGNPAHTPGISLLDTLQRYLQRLNGLAFGHGVFDNIAEGYLFLMRNYRIARGGEEEDQLWFFGFSRGAFTARSIAGLVNRFGILPPHLESLVPTLLYVYFAGDPRKVGRIAKQIEQLFALEPGPAKPFIHFVGVWDTVEAVGSGPFALKISANAGLRGKRFVHVRHALALDEHRNKFQPRLYHEPNGPTALAGGGMGSLRQLWFRGAHGDVGGGYRRQHAGLSAHPLVWMVDEAAACGLTLEHQGRVLDGAQALALLPPLHDPHFIHSELQSAPLWAIFGMGVRSTLPVAVPVAAGRPANAEPAKPAPMEEHPSVAAWPRPRMPEDTQWRKGAIGKSWWWALAAAGIFWALQAWAHQGAGFWNCLEQGPGACLRQGWQWAVDFQRWQLGLFFFPTVQSWVEQACAFHAPAWAVFWDFGFIVAYCRLLAPWHVRSFAQEAGFRRVGLGAPVWLGAGGMVLSFAFWADVGENLLSWAVLGLMGLGHEALATCLGMGLSAASVMKWLGLGATLGMVLLGVATTARLAARRRWRAMISAEVDDAIK